MKTCAIIPLKKLLYSKSRLSAILNEKQRKELTLYMLKDVINACLNSKRLNSIFIVSQDDIKFSDFGDEIKIIVDSGELNEAIKNAILRLREYDIKIIIPCDIPLLEGYDIDFIIENAIKYDIILSPSCDSGTNLLCIKGVNDFKLEFGEGKKSFISHLKNAIESKLNVKVISNERIALDIDDDTRLLYLSMLDADKYSIKYLKGALYEGNKNHSN